MPKKKYLLNNLEKRIDRLKVATHDAVAANRLNDKDLEKLQKKVEKLQSQLRQLEVEYNDTNKKKIETETEFQKRVKIHRKITLKKKRDSVKFSRWLFNNNEL